MTERGRQTFPLSFHVNGSRHDIEVEPHELLLDVVRKRLGLTGAKRSCDVQVCGACTVLIDGVPARSFLAFAAQCGGADIVTVEGLEDGPLQAAFRRHFAVQCGFCTPGILLSLTAFLRERPNPGERAVREMLSGHLCRCTGYGPIVAAALEAAGA